MKNPQHYWCITCDAPATECECGNTDGWKWSPPLVPFSGPRTQPVMGQAGPARDARPVNYNEYWRAS